jgi:hypothetical protein
MIPISWKYYNELYIWYIFIANYSRGINIVKEYINLVLCNMRRAICSKLVYYMVKYQSYYLIYTTLS